MLVVRIKHDPVAIFQELRQEAVLKPRLYTPRIYVFVTQRDIRVDCFIQYLIAQQDNLIIIFGVSKELG